MLFRSVSQSRYKKQIGVVGQDYGEIVITSRPAGAQIYTETGATGMLTPQRFRAAPGDRVFTLKKPGYLDTRIKVTVIKNRLVEQTGLMVLRTLPLTNRAGYVNGAIEQASEIYITSTPPQATISIDGQIIGKNTPERLALPLDPNPYTIVLSKVGHDDTPTATIVNQDFMQEAHLVFAGKQAVTTSKTVF